MTVIERLSARRPSPTVAPLEADRAAGRLVAAPAARSRLERCRPHLGALWILAWLAHGDRDCAEDAVVDAVTAAMANPVSAVAGPPWMWAVLAAHIDHTRTADPSKTSPPGPTRAQCQTVALVAAGHRPGQVAALLGVSAARVHHDLTAGLTALRSELADAGRVAVVGPVSG